MDPTVSLIQSASLAVTNPESRVSECRLSLTGPQPCSSQPLRGRCAAVKPRLLQTQTPPALDTPVEIRRDFVLNCANCTEMPLPTVSTVYESPFSRFKASSSQGFVQMRVSWIHLKVKYHLLGFCNDDLNVYIFCFILWRIASQMKHQNHPRL